MKTAGHSRERTRRYAAAAAVIATSASIWLFVGGAVAQVPVPAPTTPTSTIPAEPPAPPDDAEPPGVDPTTPPNTSPSPAPTPAPVPEQAPPPTPLGAAPAPTTTTPAGAPSSGRLSAAGGFGAPGTFSAGAPGIDLSEIAALRAAAHGKGPRLQPPDHGYEGALPFSGRVASQSPSEAEELGADEEQEGRVRSLGAVAAGSMASVLLLLVRWLLRQAGPATG